MPVGATRLATELVARAVDANDQAGLITSRSCWTLILRRCRGLKLACSSQRLEILKVRTWHRSDVSSGALRGAQVAVTKWRIHGCQVWPGHICIFMPTITMMYWFEQLGLQVLTRCFSKARPNLLYSPPSIHCSKGFPTPHQSTLYGTTSNARAVKTSFHTGLKGPSS